MLFASWLRFRKSILAYAGLLTALGALALAACQSQPQPAGPPTDPPSGPLRPDEPIPYATLAEHLSFNTKSRMELMRLSGQVVQVRGPVWKIESAGPGVVIFLGTEQASQVRVQLAEAVTPEGVLPGQEVEVMGTFAFRGDYVLLQTACLGGDSRPPADSAP